MGAANNPKRERQIEEAQNVAKSLDGNVLSPDILFGRASQDDLAAYTPEMLALSARPLFINFNRAGTL